MTFPHSWKKVAVLQVFFIFVCACLVTSRTLGNVGADLIKSSKPVLLTNVILITISTLRADHTGCLSYKRDTTPNLDELGKQAVLFRNAFAASGWTMPAHGSIFTSLYPKAHGAVNINSGLAAENNTLAEILKNNGYYCAGFCCNPRLGQKQGFAQGFDLYDDYSVSLMLNSLAFENNRTVNINRKRTNGFINDAATRWLQDNTQKPFFIFLHYYDNHWDYLPPAPYDKLYDPNYRGPIDGTNIAREPLFSNPPTEQDIRHIIALYDGELRQTDNDLGEILRFLKKKKLLDNSIIVIVGDHGEQFYEHGHTSRQGIYEELIHIPLVISVPGAHTKAIDSLASQVDILPTILDYLQIPLPSTCQGKSLKPLIEGQTEIVNDFVFVEYTGGTAPDCAAVRSTQYKYYEQAGDTFAYDLLKDPGEQFKISPPDFTEEIKSLQKAFHKRIELGNRIR
jgi:arylsulfatase A-like enzyme